MFIISVIVISVIFQFVAALLAIRLIHITGKSLGWIAISVAIVFMGVRRLGSAYHAIFIHAIRPELSSEILGLVTSILMVIGMALIAPIFRSMKGFQDSQRALIDELEVALANINTLKGLLPICASCKKIRDDKGYWNQIETYLGSHSEVEFSHGICPDCAKELYGKVKKSR